jgi:hypothetical protein
MSFCCTMHGLTLPQMFTEVEMYLSWAKHKAVANSCYNNLKLVTLACPLLVRDVLEKKMQWIWHSVERK